MKIVVIGGTGLTGIMRPEQIVGRERRKHVSQVDCCGEG